MNISFRTKLSKWEGKGGWYYVYLPKDISSDIKQITADMPRKGFGSVRITASLGSSTWESSIFPDSDAGKYILFIKKAIRQAEAIDLGDQLDISLNIATD